MLKEIQQRMGGQKSKFSNFSGIGREGNILSSFLSMVSRVRKGSRFIISALPLLLAVFIVYRNDFGILLNEALSNEAYTHILLTPILAGFLVYTRIGMVKAQAALRGRGEKYGVRVFDDLIGATLCLISFLIYWYGSRTFYPLEYHILSLPVLVAGITLIILGLKALRILLFPILFLVFLTPPPMEILYSIAGVLAEVETHAAYMVLNGLKVPVELSTAYGPPTIYLIRSVTGEPAGFTVDLPCSGVYTLIGLLMFSSFLALITKGSIPRRLSIFAVSLPILEALNIIRITTIVSIAYYMGSEVAQNIFHVLAGPILVFLGSLLALTISERAFKIQVYSKPKERSCRECEENKRNNEAFCRNCGRFLNLNVAGTSKLTLSKAVILLIACSLITMTINAPTLAIAQDSIRFETDTSGGNSTQIFPETPEYKVRFLYRDERYERIAGQDAALVYAYLPKNSTKPLIFATINVAGSLSKLHSWEVCLITWQTAHGRYPLVEVLESTDIQLSEDLPIVARYLAFKTPRNYTQITLYWFQKANFETGLTVQQKYVRINLIILTFRRTSTNMFKDELLDLGRAIAYHWKTITTQSMISLGIPTIQVLLAACVSLAILLKATQYIYESRMRTRNMRVFRSFASKGDRILLETIQKISEEKGRVELIELKERLRKEGRFMNDGELKNGLERLEKYGFIRRDVVSMDDTPRLVWRTYLSQQNIKI